MQNTNLFPGFVKLKGHETSTVRVVSSNSCVRSSPKTKISFLNIITMHRRAIINSKNNNIFTPFRADNENCERASNPVP